MDQNYRSLDPCIPQFFCSILARTHMTLLILHHTMPYFSLRLLRWLEKQFMTWELAKHSASALLTTSSTHTKVSYISYNSVKWVGRYVTRGIAQVTSYTHSYSAYSQLKGRNNRPFQTDYKAKRRELSAAYQFYTSLQRAEYSWERTGDPTKGLFAHRNGISLDGSLMLLRGSFVRTADIVWIVKPTIRVMMYGSEPRWLIMGLIKRLRAT